MWILCARCSNIAERQSGIESALHGHHLCRCPVANPHSQYTNRLLKRANREFINHCDLFHSSEDIYLLFRSWNRI
jgi:hypothetical protein